MAKKPESTINYEALRAELDEILDSLQRDDLAVDKALEQYQRGLELTRQLEAYLKTAENQAHKLKAKFDEADAAA
jgi:exodeoxyribonuclease VII small subunit